MGKLNQGAGAPPGVSPGGQVLAHLHEARDLLRRHGFLLLSDGGLPSVATLVTGEPVPGPWWSHPRGEDVQALSRELAADRDVLTTRLVSGRVTYVHRTLWRDLVAAGSAAEPWQFRGLSRAARSLYEMSRREGVLRTDDDIVRLVIDPASPSAATRELERRLLICALEVRIEGGTRTWIVESWDRVAHREELAPLPLPALARERLASAVMAAIPASGVTQEPRLPWEGATGQS